MKIKEYVPLEIQVYLIFIGKKHFDMNPLRFLIYADFEADNENDISSVGKKQLIFINKIWYLMFIV